MDESLARDQNQFRDPHRRWLRHTYQEGPGFRFLAMRGGRPPELDQHRSDAAIVRARARAVRLARDTGIAAALAAGSLSRTTLWRWTCAYERDGLAALVPERRGPRHPALKHPGWVEQVVIAVRLHTYWNAKRIAAELRRREIAVVSHGRIEQLFDDLGAARPSLPRQGRSRYERSIPTSLWHIDINGPAASDLSSWVRTTVRTTANRGIEKQNGDRNKPDSSNEHRGAEHGADADAGRRLERPGSRDVRQASQRRCRRPLARPATHPRRRRSPRGGDRILQDLPRPTPRQPAV